MKKSITLGCIAVLVGLIVVVVVAGYHFFYPKQYSQIGNGEYVKVDSFCLDDSFPIDKNTNIVMEYYYVDEDRLLTEQNVKIPALLGCDKTAVQSYLSQYMKSMSQEDKSKGLISFELMKCQNSEITLRKTFQKKEINGFYAKSFNGNVVIFYGDQKTVYEYTPILIHLLPKDLQDKIQKGYYLDNEEVLYDFLENYSS